MDQLSKHGVFFLGLEKLEGRTVWSLELTMGESCQALGAQVLSWF